MESFFVDESFFCSYKTIFKMPFLFLFYASLITSYYSKEKIKVQLSSFLHQQDAP